MVTKKEKQISDAEYRQKQKTHYGNQYSQMDAFSLPDKTLWDWCRDYPFIVLDPFFSCLRGSSVLVICAGHGQELRVLSEKGLKVTATDLTIDHLNQMREKGLIEEVHIADAEALFYDRDSFDYGFVCKGLHHLQRPHLGLHELLRCSQKGIIFIESQDSFLHYLIRKFGPRAKDFELAGNYVYRWSRREIEKVSLSVNAHSFAINTHFIPMLPWMRRIEGLNLTIAKNIFKLLNIFLSRIGNGMIVMIFKEPPSTKQIATLSDAGFDYKICHYPEK